MAAPTTDTQDPEQAIIAELLKNQWVSHQQISMTQESISARRLNGPIHHALFQQRLLRREQVDKLDEILHSKLVIGRFKVERKLGSGAMGDVFLAHDEEGNDGAGERVALKIISKRFADDESFIRRFDREIQSLTQLHHPSIANAVEYGRHEGLPYLAMQYIEGPSLAQLLAKHGPLPEPYALRIIWQLAQGLDYVYSETKLVHRDIKPENILVVPEAGARGEDLFNRMDQAVLIDFGLARSFGDDERLTMTGITMGTPHYMSPEQIRGSQDIDSRSDIYGLGATLFHLLTGRTPYKGSSPGAVMTAHLTEPVPDPRELVPALGEACRTIVRMSLAKDPADRYLNHQALAMACEQALAVRADEPSSAMRLLRKPMVLNKPQTTRKDAERPLAKGGAESVAKATERIAKAAGGHAGPAGREITQRNALPATPGVKEPSQRNNALPATSGQDEPLPDIMTAKVTKAPKSVHERILQKLEDHDITPIKGSPLLKLVEPTPSQTNALVEDPNETGAVAYPHASAGVAIEPEVALASAEPTPANGKKPRSGTEALAKLSSQRGGPNARSDRTPAKGQAAGADRTPAHGKGMVRADRTPLGGAALVGGGAVALAGPSAGKSTPPSVRPARDTVDAEPPAKPVLSLRKRLLAVNPIPLLILAVAFAILVVAIVARLVN